MTANTYQPDIPLRKDKFNDSQGEFLTNFMDIFNAFSQNHVPLNATSNAGNHTIIQLLEQSTGTQFQTNAGEISAYVKNVPGQTDQVFLRYQGNQKEFQFTNYQLYSLPAIGNQIPFFTFLPGKIIMYFGFVNPLSNIGTIDLTPKVSINICGVNIGPLGDGSFALYPPTVNVQQDQFGKYSNLNLQTSTLLTDTIPPCFYIIMGNL